MSERYFIVFWKVCSPISNYNNIDLNENIRNDEETVKTLLCEKYKEYDKKLEIIDNFKSNNMIFLKTNDISISESELEYFYSNFFVKNNNYIGKLALFVKEISSPYPILSVTKD